jgi:hypothetical protein
VRVRAFCGVISLDDAILRAGRESLDRRAFDGGSALVCDVMPHLREGVQNFANVSFFAPQIGHVSGMVPSPV